MFSYYSKILLSAGECYFSALLSPKFENSEGTYFIPRDGKSFSYILEYLTYGSIISVPDDAAMLKKVILDADYFGLPQLSEALKKIKSTAAQDSSAPGCLLHVLSA